MGSNLEAAAREMIRQWHAGGKLEELVKTLEAAVAESIPDAHEVEYRDVAIARHAGNPEIEVDENAIVSVGNDGAFVSAWVFVSNDDLKDADTIDGDDADPDEEDDDEEL